jgi:hypothetical protein
MTATDSDDVIVLQRASAPVFLSPERLKYLTKCYNYTVREGYDVLARIRVGNVEGVSNFWKVHYCGCADGCGHVITLAVAMTMCGVNYMNHGRATRCHVTHHAPTRASSRHSRSQWNSNGHILRDPSPQLLPVQIEGKHAGFFAAEGLVVV